MLPESFPARGEHLSQQWPLLESLDLSSFEPGKTLTSAVVAELTSGAKQLVNTHIEEDVTVSAEENLKRVLKCAKILQFAFELEQYQAEEVEQDLERKVDALANDLQEAENDCEELRMQIARNGEEDVATTNQKIELVLNELEEERVKNDRMERETKKLEKQLDQERQNTQQAEQARRDASERNAELEDRIRVAEEDVAELRSHLATEQKRAVVRGDDDKQLNSRLIKYTREIDRLQRENTTLAEANAEIQSKNEQCQGEIIDLSESLLAMDQSNSDRGNAISTLEDSYRELELERDNMAMRISELEDSVDEKVALLEEFERRFKQQYENWVEERRKLSNHAAERQASQMQRIEKSLSDPTAVQAERAKIAAISAEGSDSAAPDSAPQAQDSAGLQQKYVESQEKVVLLLEAYEQLEKDTAREVDHALQIQKTKLDRLQTELKIKEEALDIERERFQQLDQALAETQQQLEEAELRNKDYEAGVYGLPEAVTEIKSLKQDRRSMGAKLNDALRKLSGISLEAEGVLEENALLREKLGLPADEKLVTKDFRLQSQVTVAQLRAINSQLQREIMELEEDRRKLKMEMRFRAKWQGEHALHMGLSPNQLLLLEEYADSLRYGGGTAAPESKVLGEMERQISALEERLALAQAALGHPEAVRGDLGAVALSGGAESLHRDALVTQNLQGVVASLRERNDELSREAQHFQINLAKLLREMEDSKRRLEGEGLAAVEAVGAKVGAILAAVAQEGGPGPVQAAEVVAGTPRRQLDARFASVEKDLELKTAELESRNLVIESLQRELSKVKEEVRASQEREVGSADQEPGSPARQEDDLDINSSALVMQLAQCMNIQGKHEGETKQLLSELQRYKTKLQTFVDQRSILYRQYFAAEQKWKREADQLRDRIDTLEQENAEQKVRMIEIDRLNAVLQGSNDTEMAQELRKIVGKGAVLQVKNMRLARRLDVCTGAERGLKREKAQLLEDIQQLSAGYRAEIRQLEYSKRVAEVAIQRLYREVEHSVPGRLFEEVLAQKVALQSSLRELVECSATEATRRVEQQEMEAKVAELTREVEEARSRETKEAERSKERGEALDAARSSGEARYEEKLREEVVNLRTAVANARRRAEMDESARRRFEDTEAELRENVKELEEALQRHVSLLHASREAETKLTKKVSTMVHRDVHDNLELRLQQREKENTELQLECSSIKDALQSRDEAQVRLKSFEGAYLQDIASLKEALRNMSDAGDRDHVINRLHEELLHLRAKEAAMKMSLARAETRSQRLEKQCEKLNNKVQETMRELWGERENLKSKFKHQHKLFDRLETELSGRVEFQKAHKWARTVTQLQRRTQELGDRVEEKERREMELQTDLENTKLRLKGADDLRKMMGEAPSDVHREVARIQEEYLQAKMQSSRLQREVDGLKGRAEVNEKTATESEQQLRRVEEDGLRTQLKLKDQIRELQAKEQALEESVLQLQKERDEVQATADAAGRRPADSALSDATVDSNLLRTQVEGGQSIILEQIDKIKDLRQEIVVLEQKATSAQADLEQKEQSLAEVEAERDHLLTRIEQQLSGLKLKSKGDADDEDFAVRQVKEAAEASVQRLQAIIKEKTSEIRSLRQDLEAERKRTLEETLKSNQKIQELRLSAEKAKVASAKTFSVPSAPSGQAHPSAKGRYALLKYEQLVDTLEERDHNIEALKSQLEQAESKHEITRTKLAHEAKVASDGLQRFKLDVERERARSSTKIMEITIAKLKGQLAQKDKRLVSLKEAIKTLEEQLVKVMQVNASQTILESDVNLTVQEQRERERLESNKERLAARLRKSQEECKKLKEIVQEKNDAILTLEERLTRLRQQGSGPGGAAEMTDEQLLAEDPATSADLMDPELMRKRIRVLETRNQRLRVMVGANQTLAAAGGGTPKRRAKPASARKASRNVGIATDASEDAAEEPAATPEPAVRVVRVRENPEMVKWEEGKKLQRQVEAQKLKCQKLQQKLDAAEKDLERHKKIISNLTKAAGRAASDHHQQQAPSRQERRQAAQDPSPQQTAGAVQEKASLSLQRSLAEKDQKISDLKHKVLSLQEQIVGLEDELERRDTENKKLARRLEEAPSVGLLMQDSPSKQAGDSASAMRVFDANLERDQALAQVERYRAKIQEYFSGSSGGAARGEAPKAAPRALAKLERENQDLKNLIAGFERSIAKLKYDKENSVSNQKYMAAVQRIKELKKASSKMQEEISTTDKKHLNSIKDREGKIQDLTAEVALVRRKLKEKASVEDACELLRRKLEEKEMEVEHLGIELEGEREKAALYFQGKDSPSPKKSQEDRDLLDLEEELNNYKIQARELQLENTDLRNELNAFDPSFFEEIEDLKHEHFQLTKRCSEYEETIRDLRGRG